MSFTERIPARVVLGCMIFWYALTAFNLRVNLSLTIVAMVGKKQGLNSTSQLNTSGCLKDYSNTSFQPVEDIKSDSMTGEFNWSETTQGTILSAFFWGYVLLQLPGGRLAELIGSRRVLGYALLTASLMSACIPMFARMHYGLLVFARVVQGLALGVQFPSISVLATHWVPVLERARFYSIFAMGGTLGIALMMPLCGLIIAYFGWAALFYACAAQGFLFTICWFILVHDTPRKHPRISSEERDYIERGLTAGNVKALPIPWKKILTSMQMWSPFLAAIGSDWGFYTILTLGPKYISSILGVNMKQNGLLFALPFLCRYTFGMLVAQLLDFLLRRQYITLIQMRRCAVLISHFLPALALVAFPLVGCDMVPAVTLLCLAMAANGAITSGHIQAYMDVAPNFAGTLGGFKNGLCSFTGIISPLIVGAILEQDASVAGWRVVFALSAGIYASSIILFLIFFTARIQPWNESQMKPSDEELRQPMRPNDSSNITAK